MLAEVESNSPLVSLDFSVQFHVLLGPSFIAIFPSFRSLSQHSAQESSPKVSSTSKSPEDKVLTLL